MSSLRLYNSVGDREKEYSKCHNDSSCSGEREGVG